MKILFVNHTGAASGAEFALMRLVSAVRRRHHVAVACPSSGPLVEMLEEAAVQHVTVPAFEASMRLDLVRTPVNMGRLMLAGAALGRAARRFEADLLHANTPRAGLIGALANGWGGPPLVVRAHEHLPPNTVGRGVRFVLRRCANAILTVSRETERKFNHGLDRPAAIHVYNSFDRERFDPDRVDGAGVREELGIGPQAALLGQIGQITPWKGQDTSIRALARLRETGVDAQLLLVGEVAFSGSSVRYDNQAYLRDLHRLVDELGLREHVHFLGQRRDVPGILSDIDLSLLPSWDEPFANVMLESMAMGTPLLVSREGGGPELVEDGISGRILPPKRPDLWAAASQELLEDPQALLHMGLHARRATERFSDQAHARDMLEVYDYVLSRPEARPAHVATTLSSRRTVGGGRAGGCRRSSRERNRANVRLEDAGLAGSSAP
jgi:L-malate glycosyltransferase